MVSVLKFLILISAYVRECLHFHEISTDIFRDKLNFKWFSTNNHNVNSVCMCVHTCACVCTKSVCLHKCGKMLIGESRWRVYRTCLYSAGYVSVSMKLSRNKNFKLSILTFGAYKSIPQSEYIINGKRLSSSNRTKKEKIFQRYF